MSVQEIKNKLLKKEWCPVRWDTFHTWEEYVNHIEYLRDARLIEINDTLKKRDLRHKDLWEDHDIHLEDDVFYDLKGSHYFNEDRLLTRDERYEVEKNISRMHEYAIEYISYPDLMMKLVPMTDDKLLQYEAEIKDAWDDQIYKHREG